MVPSNLRNVTVIDIPLTNSTIGRRITVEVDPTDGRVVVRGARQCIVWTQWGEPQRHADEPRPSNEEPPDEIGVVVTSRATESVSIHFERTGKKPWWRSNGHELSLIISNFGASFGLTGEKLSGSRILLFFGKLRYIIGVAPYETPERLTY
jgi:hypothetical protein